MNYRSKLYEGLIYTHELQSSVNMINRYGLLDRTGEKAEAYEVNNIIKIKLAIDRDIESRQDNIDRFEKKMNGLFRLTNNLGWFASIIHWSNRDERIKFDYNKDVSKGLIDWYKSLKDNDIPSKEDVLMYDYVYIVISFEAKFDREVEPQDTYYHATRSAVLDKIKKFGLVPKSKWKRSRHPDRIYLTKTNFYALSIAVSINYELDEDVVILEVNVGKMNKQIRVFNDPNMNKIGVYTLENIPPNVIKVIDL